MKATGRLKANLEQSCVASGEPIATSVDEPFELHFQPEPSVIVIAFVVALVVGLLGGALPSIRAARLDPVTALRGGVE